MNLKEYNNNQFIKTSTEVEKYLLRIIQRYFDIENNGTKESIEAMIIESLTRFKQIMITEKGFIFSLNKQTGNIALTIKDLGGEKRINKKTAFNKDFGIDTDTICEGNDERLYNDREPLEHTHDILSVQELKETLQSVQLLKDIHYHDNKSLLDILSYTGASTTVDLIILEQLERTVENYCGTLNNYKTSIKNFYDDKIDTIVTHKALILTELSHAKEIVKQSHTWLDDTYEYIEKELYNVRNNITKDISRYITKDMVEALTDFIKQTYFISQYGEVIIPKGDVTCIPYDVTTIAEHGKTFIQEESTFTISLPKANNFRPKLYFRYEDENDVTQTFPLPFYVRKENRTFLVDGSYDTDYRTSNIYITSRFINEINYYANEYNRYDEDTILIATRNSANIYEKLADDAQKCDCEIALIDSAEKDTFVQGLLVNGTEYYIQGYNFVLDGPEYVDDKENVLTYTNWDEGEPNELEIGRAHV